MTRRNVCLNRDTLPAFSDWSRRSGFDHWFKNRIEPFAVSGSEEQIAKGLTRQILDKFNRAPAHDPAPPVFPEFEFDGTMVFVRFRNADPCDFVVACKTGKIPCAAPAEPPAAPFPPSHFEAQQRELAERKAEARRAFLSWALDVGFFGWFKNALHDANARAALEPRETERIRARLGDKIRAEMHHFAATSGTPYPPVRVHVSAESSVLDVAFLPIVRRAEVPTASGNCALCELGGYTPHKAGTPKPPTETAERFEQLEDLMTGRASSAAPNVSVAPRDEPPSTEGIRHWPIPLEAPPFPQKWYPSCTDCGKRVTVTGVTCSDCTRGNGAVEMTEGRRALVAQAFGELVGRIYNHAPKGLTIRTFARSMHAALGERIPDA